MEHFFGSLDTVHLIFLVLALLLALGFEFVNGFHDTANAVATVIYTKSLSPWVAVIWSGLWNLIGVLSSTGMVAFGIVGLFIGPIILAVAWELMTAWIREDQADAILPDAGSNEEKLGADG